MVEEQDVRTNLTYPKEYQGPKPINDQIEAIAEIYGLDPSHALEYAKNLPTLPEGAEGWFAIPSVDALAARHFPEIPWFGLKYCRVVQLMLHKIAKTRALWICRDGQITPERLRVSARTAHALDLVAEQQPGDILIIAAQLGMRHRGRSVCGARAVFAPNEFGLTSFVVGSIVLVHPKRIIRWEELEMDCSGDEFDEIGDDGGFSYAPIFRFYDGKVEFGAHWYDYAYEHFGSASAFLSQ